MDVNNNIRYSEFGNWRGKNNPLSYQIIEKIDLRELPTKLLANLGINPLIDWKRGFEINRYIAFKLFHKILEVYFYNPIDQLKTYGIRSNIKKLYIYEVYDKETNRFCIKWKFEEPKDGVVIKTITPKTYGNTTICRFRIPIELLENRYILKHNLHFDGILINPETTNIQRYVIYKSETVQISYDKLGKSLTIKAKHQHQLIEIFNKYNNEVCLGVIKPKWKEKNGWFITYFIVPDKINKIIEVVKMTNKLRLVVEY